MIEIDGSSGEGGGQILRTALSLSCLLQKPFRVVNIRKLRKKPGLMPQHLTCVRAAQLISSAHVEGDAIGSAELAFSPRRVMAGEFLFDVGTAGSTLLVLQTLIPALIFSGEKSVITLKGGTHVPFSPSYHYIKGVFMPFLERIGITMSLSIDFYGFFPRGGGKITVALNPVAAIHPLTCVERGRFVCLRGFSCVGNLPRSIAERQKRASMEALYPTIRDMPGTVDMELEDVRTPGQGTCVFLQAEFEHSCAGFSALGERGKKAEQVGQEAAEAFCGYYKTGAALDPYLPDQMVLYLSLCTGHSEFSTSRITEHLMTNLRVIKLFTEFDCSVDAEIGAPGTVRIN